MEEVRVAASTTRTSPPIRELAVPQDKSASSTHTFDADRQPHPIRFLQRQTRQGIVIPLRVRRLSRSQFRDPDVGLRAGFRMDILVRAARAEGDCINPFVTCVNFPQDVEDGERCRLGVPGWCELRVDSQPAHRQAPWVSDKLIHVEQPANLTVTPSQATLQLHDLDRHIRRNRLLRGEPPLFGAGMAGCYSALLCMTEPADRMLEPVVSCIVPIQPYLPDESRYTNADAPQATSALAIVPTPSSKSQPSRIRRPGRSDNCCLTSPCASPSAGAGTPPACDIHACPSHRALPTRVLLAGSRCRSAPTTCCASHDQVPLPGQS
jgi:hypothetical protein